MKFLKWPLLLQNKVLELIDMPVDILVISIANPLLVGIYENKKLIKTYAKEGKTSDILPLVFEEILNEFKLKELYYVNSPGSYMAIKVAYVFLKTIAISKNIKLKATFGFNFNNQTPIRALGKKYFIYDDKEIKIDFIKDNTILREFELPKILDDTIFEYDCLPKYNLPAV